MYFANRVRQKSSVLFLLALLLACICFAQSIRMQMQDAIQRCLTVIIPSLYAMMILSQLLVSTNAWRSFARPLRRVSPKLFGLPGGCLALFLLSQFAGYPVGAGMLRTLHANGVLSEKDACRLLCVCYGSGPAFLLGLLGALPCRSRLFLMIFAAQLISNLLLVLILFRRHPVVLPPQKDQRVQPVTASMLVQSTTQAGKSLLRLCGIILCFSAFCAILEELHFFHFFKILAQRLSISFPITTIVQSILEVSNTATMSLPFSIQIPVFAGLLSFGGFCVILQVRAAAGTIFRLRLFLLCRIFTGLLSALLCRIGLLLFSWDFPVAEAVSATCTSYQVQHSAYFPVCMLLVMMVLLFYETEKRA